MLSTVTLPVLVKNWPSIPLWEVYLLSKFGKLGSSTSRNMTDKQNHMIMSILCYQHLRRIAFKLFTKRCVCCLSFMTVPPLEKEMCLIVKVTQLGRCDIAIACGGMFLWRKFSLSGVWLSKFNFAFNFENHLNR